MKRLILSVFFAVAVASTLHGQWMECSSGTFYHTPVDVGFQPLELGGHVQVGREIAIANGWQNVTHPSYPIESFPLVTAQQTGPEDFSNEGRCRALCTRVGGGQSECAYCCRYRTCPPFPISGSNLVTAQQTIPSQPAAAVPVFASQNFGPAYLSPPYSYNVPCGCGNQVIFHSNWPQ